MRRSHQGPVNLFCLTTVHLINSSSPRIPHATSRITFSVYMPYSESGLARVVLY